MAQVREPHELPHLERWPMSVEEYLSLPEGLRAEYVDGEAIVSPPASSGHNTAQRRLANTIEAGLVDEVDVRTDAGWGSGEHYRIPDIAVFTTKDDVVFDASAPVLVAEVLSPSTATEDTVRKSTEYLAAGVSQYWILDRANHELVVYGNHGSGWEPVAVLDADRPTGMVRVGEWGEVAVDLDAVLRS